MLKLGAWPPVLIFCALFTAGVAASDLRELFYSRIRDILNTPPINPENSPLAPKRPVEQREWGAGLEGKLGQVSGVSVNNYGQPVLFHRGPRSWDSSTQLFNNSNYFIGLENGPIQVDTILTLDPVDGSIVESWGKGLFYLPHGITIDHHDNTWVTDIAMHQVLKFPYRNHRMPTLRLGELFTPGSSTTRFCKPTSVAVALNGQIFVADGYCNNRIMKFNHEGKLIRIFPQNGEFLSLLIPHSITLMHNLDLLCVADRENMRVACFDAELCPTLQPRSSSPFTIHQPDLGRVFGIAASGARVCSLAFPSVRSMENVYWNVGRSNQQCSFSVLASFSTKREPLPGIMAYQRFFVQGPVTNYPYNIRNLAYAVNGPTSSHIPIQGFTIDPTAELIVDHWMPSSADFTNPHDIAISPYGDALYVVEIGPNKVWKFNIEGGRKKNMYRTTFC